MNAHEVRKERRDAAGGVRVPERPTTHGSGVSGVAKLAAAIKRSFGGGLERLNDGLARTSRLRWPEFSAAALRTAAATPVGTADSRARTAASSPSRRRGKASESDGIALDSLARLTESIARLATFDRAARPRDGRSPQPNDRTPGSSASAGERFSRVATIRPTRLVRELAAPRLRTAARDQSVSRHSAEAERTSARAAHLAARIGGMTDRSRSLYPHHPAFTFSRSPRPGASSLVPAAGAHALAIAGRSATNLHSTAAAGSNMIAALSRFETPVRAIASAAAPENRPQGVIRRFANEPPQRFAGESGAPEAVIRRSAVLSRNSGVRAVSRMFASPHETETPEARTNASASRRSSARAEPSIVVHYAPSLHVGGALGAERTEQAVAEALSRQAPDLLRQLRAEIAKRRRTEFT